MPVCQAILAPGRIIRDEKSQGDGLFAKWSARDWSEAVKAIIGEGVSTGT